MGARPHAFIFLVMARLDRAISMRRGMAATANKIVMPGVVRMHAEHDIRHSLNKAVAGALAIDPWTPGSSPG
jgi:hypothetical protein